MPVTLPVYNLDPAKRGLVDRLVTNAASDEQRREVYTGFELSWNARLRNGAQLFGGYTAEREVALVCDSPDDPNTLFFCDGRQWDIPWTDQLKIAGSWPFPYGLQLSGSWQSYNGCETFFDATFFGGVWGNVFRGGDVGYLLPAAEYVRALRRTPTVVGQAIALLPPGGRFADRLNQVDLSIAKWFNLPNGIRWKVQGDVYNLINTSPTILETATFGPRLWFPTETMQARFLQLATHLTW